MHIEQTENSFDPVIWTIASGALVIFCCSAKAVSMFTRPRNHL
jgi:hypothetical protein